MRIFTEAGRMSELGEGSMKKATVNSTDILLIRAGGKVYATGLLCPHLQADLSEGTLRGFILTCPLHHSQFDIRDGHVVRWTDLKGTILRYASRDRPPLSLKCYPVRVEGDRILVAIP